MVLGIFQLLGGIVLGAMWSARIPFRASFMERAGLTLVTAFLPILWLPLLCALVLEPQTAALTAVGLTAVLVVVELMIGGAGRARLAAEARAAWRALRAEPAARAKLLAIVAFAALFGWLCHTHFFLPGPQGLCSAGVTWGDSAMHASFATAFAQRDNLHPPEYPFYLGWPLGYPFVPDFATGNLTRLGLSLRMAFVLTTWIALLAHFLLLGGLAQRWLGPERPAAPYLVWLLFYCSGGLGFVLFFQELWQSGDLKSALAIHCTINLPYDLRLGNTLGSLLVPARNSAFGMAVAFAVLLLLTCTEEAGAADTGAETAGAARRADFLTAGLLAGTLPLIHSHSFPVVGVLGLAYCWQDRGRWREWAWFFVPFALVAVPQVIWVSQHLRRATPFLFVFAGYPYPLLSLDAVRYWLWNYAPFLIVVPVAWLLAPPRLQYLTLPLLFLFGLANLVSLTPNPYDNAKVIAYFQLGGSIVLGWVLAGWLQTARFFLPALALLAIVCLTGLQSIAYEALHESLVITTEELAVAEHIKDHTSPDAVFLTASNLTHPVPVLTGRRVLLGFKIWLYAHGIDYEQREQEIVAIYGGAKEAQDLLRRYRVDYVVVGPRERDEFPGLDEAFLARVALEQIRIGEHMLYRVR